MIQKQELRVGNFLYERPYSGCSVIYIVKQIKNRGVCVSPYGSDIEGEYSYEAMEPITITHEILEKIGFVLKKEGSYNCYINDKGFVLCMWTEDYSIIGFEKKGVCYYGEDYIEIRYLHHLQNLYFVITGKELNIK